MASTSAGMRRNRQRLKCSEVNWKFTPTALLSESSDSFKPVDLSTSSNLSPGTNNDPTSREFASKMQAKRDFAFLYRPATNGNLLQVVRRKHFAPATMKEIGKAQLQIAEVLSNRSLAIEENEESPTKQASIKCKFPYKSMSTRPKRRSNHWIPRINVPNSQPNSPRRPDKRDGLLRASITIPTESVKPSPAPLFVFRRPKRSLQMLELHQQTKKDLSLTPLPERRKSRSVHNFPKQNTKSRSPGIKLQAKIDSKDLQAALRSPPEPQAGFEEATFDPLSPTAGRKLIERAKFLLSQEVLKRHKGSKRPLMDLQLRSLLQPAS